MKSFSISNFKSFAKKQNIPVKPITLIYGANSAGKSSVIQGSLLLNHIMKTSLCDLQSIETEWDTLDIGGFQQYSYRHKYDKETLFSIDLKENIQLDLTIKAQTNNMAQLTDKLAFISSISIYVNKELVVKFSKLLPDNSVGFRVASFNESHPEWKKTSGAIFTENITPDQLDTQDILFDFYKFTNGHNIDNYDRNLFKECFKTNKDITKVQEGIQDFLAGIVNKIWAPVWESTREKDTNKNRSNITYIGPLRDYPPRVISNEQKNDDMKDHTWSILLQNQEVRESVNKWFSNTQLMNPTYRFEVEEKINPDNVILPLLEIFQQIDMSQGYIPDELESIVSIEMDYDSEGSTGQYLSSDNYTVEGAKKLLDALLVNTDKNTIYKKLLLIDERAKIPVSLRDVGVGISQVLPVLVNAYSKENNVATIEQPELHLHPKLQSELADVFINTALGKSRKTFLIETHSEHLLLRIMRRIRETTNNELEEGLTPITANDVQVLFVMPSKNGEGSVIKKIALDEDGEMIDNWPGGFFEEGFNERFGL